MPSVTEEDLQALREVNDQLREEIAEAEAEAATKARDASAELEAKQLLQEAERLASQLKAARRAAGQDAENDTVKAVAEMAKAVDVDTSEKAVPPKAPETDSALITEGEPTTTEGETSDKSTEGESSDKSTPPVVKTTNGKKG